MHLVNEAVYVIKQLLLPFIIKSITRCFEIGYFLANQAYILTCSGTQNANFLQFLCSGSNGTFIPLKLLAEKLHLVAVLGRKIAATTLFVVRHPVFRLLQADTSVKLEGFELNELALRLPISSIHMLKSKLTLIHLLLYLRDDALTPNAEYRSKGYLGIPR